MKIPNLDCIVDTYIPTSIDDQGAYLEQLRREVLPYIRKLQADRLLGWYAFLIHGPEMLEGREELDGKPYIHLRLEPSSAKEVGELIKALPDHFRKPVQVALANIGGLDSSCLRDHNWAYAWKLHGEASEWVLGLLECHGGYSVPVQQQLQFLHYITNPMMLGHRCLCAPAGFLTF